MDNSNKRIWLASYPKCGNTWFRIFLANLLGERSAEEEAKKQCCDINAIRTGSISSGRHLFDRFYGIDSSLLSQSEIECRRPEVYFAKQFESKDIKRFTKAHDAYSFLANGQPLLGDSSAQAAIYLVRNPLDTVPSYGNHNGTDDMDKTIAQLANTNHQLCKHQDRFVNQFLQRMFSWGEHVESWLDITTMPVFLMRYEDMVADTFNTFKAALEFSGVEYGDEEIRQAINESSFEKLKAKEQKEGFREKAAKADSFFRKGKVGSYRESLSQAQIKQVIEQHQRVMERLEYIKAGELVY